MGLLFNSYVTLFKFVFILSMKKLSNIKLRTPTCFINFINQTWYLNTVRISNQILKYGQEYHTYSIILVITSRAIPVQPYQYNYNHTRTTIPVQPYQYNHTSTTILILSSFSSPVQPPLFKLSHRAIFSIHHSGNWRYLPSSVGSL